MAQFNNPYALAQQLQYRINEFLHYLSVHLTQDQINAIETAFLPKPSRKDEELIIDQIKRIADTYGIGIDIKRKDVVELDSSEKEKKGLSNGRENKNEG